MQRAIDLVAIRGGFHVDQIDEDQTSEVSEAKLMDDFLNRFEIRLEDGFFQIALADEAAGVHVDRGQRFALVDDE